MTLRQTANGKNETFAVCLKSVIVEDICPFLCDLFKDYKKRIKNKKYSLPFAVCRKRHETLYCT